MVSDSKYKLVKLVGRAIGLGGVVKRQRCLSSHIGCVENQPWKYMQNGSRGSRS